MRSDRWCDLCGTRLPAVVLDGIDLGSRFVQAAAAAKRLCDPCIDRTDAEMQARQDEAACRLRRGRAGIPKGLASVTFDRLDSSGLGGALDDAKRWAGGELCGLVLSGDVGVGKTWLAAAAANARLEHAAMRWVSTPALLAKAVASDDDAKRQSLDVLTGERGAVVLDDFDKANSRSEWTVAQLFLAVDNAVEHGRPLLVTTNLGASELADRFGEAVASRLVGYCTAHRLAGVDRRWAA